MKQIFLTLLACLGSSVVLPQTSEYSFTTDTTISYQALSNGFETPPAESRLRCYWWWLNGMATMESITRDLQEMKAKGYGGASLVDAGSSNYDVARKTKAGPVFMSPEWMDLYRHAVTEADRVGIELSVNLGSGWNPGGPSITPEYALKKIVWSEKNITGGSKIKVVLPQPETNLYYRDIMVQAVKNIPNAPVKNEAIKNWAIKSFSQPIGWKGIYPLYELRTDYPGSGEEIALKPDDIIDLTTSFKDSVVEWDAPAGNWTIIRYGYTCTGARTSTTSDGWSGLSVDHLSADAFNLFADSVILPLIKTAQSVGKSVKLLQEDSWEMGVVSWTAKFPEEFRKYRGYDIQEYMPVLTGRIVENRDVSDRFLHDFRRTIGDLIYDNHYKLLYNIAHKYGMGIHPESGGPHSAPVDALEVMGISDFPQGEFWEMANTHRIKDDERLSVRQSACVAHTNGKRFVAAEGPTSIGPQWERSPKDLKSNIDRVFCSGVNRIVWHTFTSSPKEFGLPGNEYFAGTHLNPNVTWWKQAGYFTGYLNRCTFMLQQGLPVADVLYYYGDDVPNFVFLKNEIPDLKPGYDWDKCSKDVLLNRVSFDNNKIQLPDGMSYRIMMLAPEKAIDLEVLHKIEKLVWEGMTLYAPRPEEATGLTKYPESDNEIHEIASRLWGNIDGTGITENKYGQGRVIWGKNINDVLAEMKIKPDFEYSSNHEKTALDYIHRATSTDDIYFVTNRFEWNEFNDFKYRYIPELPDRYEETECRFNVTGKVPELWNPVTGETHEILTWFEADGQTIIPIHFEPQGSRFIIFRKAAQKLHIVKITKDEKPLFPGFASKTKTFPYIDFRLKDGKTEILGYEPGSYALTWSNGKTEHVQVKNKLNEISLTGPWNLKFDPNWGAPAQITADSLKSWTKFTEDGVKYYSGTATYSNTFTLTKIKTGKTKLILDLGNVQDMASVKINGLQLQVAWYAPFRFDITPYVKEGENQLDIEVTNLWPNRLIGDSKLPKDKRLTKTNVNKFNATDSEKFLRVSGLLGPVKIMVIPVSFLK